MKPLRPETRKELDYRQALKVFARGRLCERQHRLLEASRAFEEAARLDPRSGAISRALLPLYLLLDRREDALSACRKIVDLNPDDYQTWFFFARQLRELGRAEEAMAALAKAAACPGIKERPELLIQVYFDLGWMKENAKHYDQAETAYQKVVEELSRFRERPEDILDGALTRDDIEAKLAETYERIIKLHLDGQHYDRAVKAFRAARDQKVSLPLRLNLHLAKAYLAKNDPVEAKRRLEEYLRVQPPGTEGYDVLIAILQKLDQEVLPVLKQYAERDAHNVALQVLLARQYEKEGQAEKAERIYLAQAEQSPDADVYRGLFHLYHGQGRMMGALALLDQAVNKAKSASSPSAALRARSMLVVLRDDADLAKALLRVALDELKGISFGRQATSNETHQFLAVLAARNHQVVAAESLYRSCLRALAPHNEADVYGGLLRVLWEERKYQAIVDLCRQGLQQAQATNRLLFHTELAKVYMTMEKPEESLAAADQAVKIADDQNRLYCNLLRVRTLAQAGRSAQAIADCRALFDQFSLPGDIRKIRYALSGIYSDAKELAKAEEHLQLILKEDANDPSANNDLGYIWADQGKNLPEAEEMIRKAIQLDRDQKRTGHSIGADDDKDAAAYVDSLGWVLFRRGKLDAARQELEKAVALPDGASDPVIWDHLGDVYFRMDNTGKARTAWQKAVKLYEVERRRKLDQQYKDLKHKLQLLEQ